MYMSDVLHLKFLSQARLDQTATILSYIPILAQTDWFKHIVHYVYVWRQKNVMFHCVHCACA